MFASHLRFVASLRGLTSPTQSPSEDVGSCKHVRLYLADSLLEIAAPRLKAMARKDDGML